MNSKFSRSIVLVGLPGAGKTTVGRSLARNIKLEFIDTDKIIESKVGCTVREYFEFSGEASFREIESATIRELIGKGGCVISTGGGSVLDSGNRLILKQNFFCIYLRATPDELYRRLRFDLKRPLLQVTDPLQTIRQLYLDRDPLYIDVANFFVDTGRPSVAALVETIKRELQLYKQP